MDVNREVLNRKKTHSLWILILNQHFRKVANSLGEGGGVHYEILSAKAGHDTKRTESRERVKIALNVSGQ